MDYVITYALGAIGFAATSIVLIDLGVLPALVVGAASIFFISKHVKESINRRSRS